jgi:hypothetical protein
MKKFLLLLLFLSTYSLTKAQGTCSTAIKLDTTSYDGLVTQKQVLQNTWFYFSALNTDLTFNSQFYVGADKITSVILWSGTCTGLTRVSGDTVSGGTDSTLSFYTSSLTAGQTYYLQFIKSNSTDSARYAVDLNFMLAMPTCAAGGSVCELVCNGNFETGATPTAQDQLNYASPWLKCNTQTPDYFNGSATGGVDVPNNWCGVENDVSSGSGDKAYGGIVARWSSPPGTAGSREIMYQQLKCPLIAGVSYSVQMKVSLSDYSKYKVNYLGMYLSIPNPYSVTGGSITSIPAQSITSGSSYVSNSSGWTTIGGTYVAVGGEAYIAIGCFGGSLALVTPAPTIPPTTSGEYAYYYIDQVSVTPINTLTISASPNPISCGATSTLTNNIGTSGTPLLWAPSTGLSCNNCASPTTPALYTSTLYSGTITYCTGCTYTAYTTVNVTPVPVNAGADVSICSGASTTLSASGATSYSWLPTTGLSNPSISNPIASPTATTSYTVTGSVGSCTGTDVVVVTVKPIPAVNSESNLTYCNGASAPANSFTSTPTGATYTWTNSNTAIGLGASGSTSLPAFTATNSGTSPISGTLSVTPTLAGCVGSPLTFTITVNPTPNVVVPSSFSACAGATTSASSFTSGVTGTTYSWTNSNTAIGLGASGSGNVPSFAATNSTGSPISGTITVTPTANGCAGTAATYTITVNPSPTVSVSPSAPSIAFGGSVGLTASGATSYSWAPAFGLSSTAIANPTASPSATTTYTVTGTNSYGCSSTATVTVTVTLPQCGITIPSANVITGPTTITAVFGSASSATGNFSISGVLTVNHDFNFAGCNIIMDGVGAKIVVSSTYTLQLSQKTHVYSCSDLWDGIYVQSGGKVWTSGQSFIEDATKAISIADGALQCIVEETTFNRNFWGIELPTNTSASTPVIVTKSVFTSRYIPSFATPSSNPSPSTVWTTITGASPYTAATCRYPKSTEKAAYGIYASDVTLLNVGSSSGSTYFNGFDELQCGMRFIQTNAVVYNNKFRSLLNPTFCTGCANVTGYGIWASGTSSGNYSITIGGNGNNYEPNSFYNVYRSAFVQYYKTQQINWNTIDNTASVASPSIGYGNLGVWVLPSSNNTVNLSNNIVNNCITGLTLNRSMSFAVSSVAVSLNDNQISADASGSCPNGILIADISGYTNTPTTSEIKSNVITECGTGISLSYVQQPLLVETNSIECRYASSGNLNGIKAAGCVGVTIKTNHTKYNSTAGGVYPTGNITAYGIYLQNSTNMLVQCNLIEDAGRSMVFEGACSSPMPSGYGIRQNTMRRAQDGFVLLNSGVVGQQGRMIPINIPSNNYWDISSTPNFTRSQTYTDNTTGANANSRLYMSNVTTGATATMPTNNQTSGFYGTDNYLSLTGLNVLSGTPAACSTPPAFSGQVSDQKSMESEGDETDPSISEQTDELTNMILDSAEYLAFSEENHWMQKHYVYNEINQNPDLNNGEVLEDFMNDPAMNYDAISTIEQSILDGNPSQASSLNAALAPNNDIEVNLKNFNSLFLKRVQDSAYSYTATEMSELESIALLCPLSGGPAVYQARNFIMALKEMVIDYTDDCNPGDRIIHQGNNADMRVVEVYPNPNNGRMTIKYELRTGEKGSFNVFDITGKRISNYDLPGSSNKLSISNEQMASGVYFYQVRINDVPVQSDKLVIIR